MTSSAARDVPDHPGRTGPPDLDARRAARAAAAVGVVRRFCARHGLAGVEPRVLSHTANVVLALDGPGDAVPGPPLVVRTPTRTDLLAGQDPADPWRHVEEVALARWLAAAGAPVVPPAGPQDALPAGPHLVDGFVLTVWRAGRDPRDGEAGPEMLGTVLRALHEVMAGYPDARRLPPVGPAAADLDLVLATCERTGEIDAGLLPRLRRARAVVAAPLLAGASGPGAQAVHGDAHPGNLLVLDGRPVWNDLEDLCRASPGWDLGVLLSSARTDGRAAVAAYGGQGPDDLVPWVRGRELQRAVWTAVRARTPDEVAHVHALVDDLLDG